MQTQITRENNNALPSTKTGRHLDILGRTNDTYRYAPPNICRENLLSSLQEKPKKTKKSIKKKYHTHSNKLTTNLFAALHWTFCKDISSQGQPFFFFFFFCFFSFFASPQSLDCFLSFVRASKYTSHLSIWQPCNYRTPCTTSRPTLTKIFQNRKTVNTQHCNRVPSPIRSRTSFPAFQRKTNLRVRSINGSQLQLEQETMELSALHPSPWLLQRSPNFIMFSTAIS